MAENTITMFCDNFTGVTVCIDSVTGNDDTFNFNVVLNFFRKTRFPFLFISVNITFSGADYITIQFN